MVCWCRKFLSELGNALNRWLNLSFDDPINCVKKELKSNCYLVRFARENDINQKRNKRHWITLHTASHHPIPLRRNDEYVRKKRVCVCIHRLNLPTQNVDWVVRRDYHHLAHSRAARDNSKIYDKFEQPMGNDNVIQHFWPRRGYRHYTAEWHPRSMMNNVSDSERMKNAETN